MAQRFSVLALLVSLAMITAACSSTEDTTTTTAAPTATAAPETTAAAETTLTLPTLAGLRSTTISIEGRDLVAAVADTPEARGRGLMGVTDLGGVDGMLFVWEADTAAAFHMLNTLIPLDIAFFSVDGSFVHRLTMEPCTTDECPLYSADGLYRYALEAPAGDLDFMTATSKLVIDSDS